MALSQKIEKEVDAILTPQQRQQKNKLQAQALQQQKAVQAQMQKQAQREAAVYKTLTPAQKEEDRRDQPGHSHACHGYSER